MNHRSKILGTIEYSAGEVFTFGDGLIGFPDDTRYILRSADRAGLMYWLICVDADGPEFLAVRPEKILPRYNLKSLVYENEKLSFLRASLGEEHLFCIVSVPENIRHTSMNLRTPLFLNSRTRTGMQYGPPGLQRKPIRYLIHRELTGCGAEEERSGTLVIQRKLNETVYIGDDIIIEVLDFARGSVKLGVNAPRKTNVLRGETRITPQEENIRANRTANAERLQEVLRSVKASGR